MRKVLLLASIFISIAIFSSIRSYADEYDDITKQLNDLRQSLESSQQATKNNESNLSNLNKQLDGIKYRVSLQQAQITQKEKEVKKGEEARDVQKDILNQRTISYYKNLNKNSFTLINALVADNLTSSMQQFFFEKSLIDDDRKTILKVVSYIKELEEKKATLVKENAKLLVIKREVDSQSKFLSGEVTKAKQFQNEVSGKIAELSAKQNQILAAKGGSFIAGIGDIELADDYNASIKGFRESAPGGYFAVFSFGAYTHRKGMSQYGARGRAQSGQDYKAILNAYYHKDPVDKDTGGDISVSGYGSMSFEDHYLMGIAEMPSSWHPEALKAQAIAARTYAYRYKADGREICATEACQVYSPSKADNPPDAWRQAVQDTRGKVIEDVTTFFSSTAGGWSSTAGWDTSDGSGGSNFIDKAWEKAGGSPWLYKAWYRAGYTSSGDSCGRANPWLSPEEMADIVNAYLVLTQSNDQGEKDRITPITTSCWGGSPYSMEELRNVAGRYGGISRADNVTVSQGDGNTNTVTINGINISGSNFDKAFTLRAPGYLRIPQSGFSFFNIERK
ncbi:MAG: SpoIID/LytB domain-containing protein [Patescibacteria group bacterium]